MAAARTAAAVALLGASIAAAVGCTFLITFDDVPKRDAGTPTATSPPDTTTPPIDTIPTSTPFDSGLPPTSESCDTSLNRAQVNGCDQFSVPDAQVCAHDSSLSPYPFTSTVERDLVTCNEGAATCIVHCATRCVGLPSGSPDQCDHCAGRTNGLYCGSELSWVTKDSNLLVQCSSGAVATTPAPTRCTNTCVPGSPAGSARCSP